jgi:hypothetical protein
MSRKISLIKQKENPLYGLHEINIKNYFTVKGIPKNSRKSLKKHFPDWQNLKLTDYGYGVIVGLFALEETIADPNKYLAHLGGTKGSLLINVIKQIETDLFPHGNSTITYKSIGDPEIFHSWDVIVGIYYFLHPQLGSESQYREGLSDLRRIASIAAPYCLNLQADTSFMKSEIAYEILIGGALKLMISSSDLQHALFENPYKLSLIGETTQPSFLGSTAEHTSSDSIDPREDFCTNCGNNLESENNFCGKCGTSLR